jgi:antitoxin (DNA-binding transcriptional repressor) of toxin-antitoxin stability system
VVPSSPVKAFDLTVRLDYGQFHLSSLPLPDGAGDDLLQLVEEAAHGQGIAVTEGNELVVVISPHQNNFAMPLRVEVWPAEPPSDLDDWQEAFLTGLVVGPAGLAYESPTMEEATVPVPPGRYAVRITGRGFVNHGWPGSTTPGDHWRLQLWPTPDPIRPRRLRAWTKPEPTPRLAGEPTSREDA